MVLVRIGGRRGGHGLDGFRGAILSPLATPESVVEESSKLLSGREGSAYENDKSTVRTSRDLPEDPEELDLHGLSVAQALRRVSQALHAARVRGSKRLVVITGAGWGNRDAKPVLRPALETWLRGPEGRALGVKDVRQVHRGGALDLWLQ